MKPGATLPFGWQFHSYRARHRDNVDGSVQVLNNLCARKWGKTVVRLSYDVRDPKDMVLDFRSRLIEVRNPNEVMDFFLRLKSLLSTPEYVLWQFNFQRQKRGRRLLAVKQ